MANHGKRKIDNMAAKQLVADGDATGMAVAREMVRKGFGGHPVMRRRTSYGAFVKMVSSGLKERLGVTNPKRGKKCTRRKRHREVHDLFCE